MKLALVTALALIVGIPQLAHASRYDTQQEVFKHCSGIEVEQDLRSCMQRLEAEVQARLQQNLTVLTRNYGKDESQLLELLNLSQAAWQQYVEAQCEVDTYYNRGTAYGSFKAACEISEAYKRADELEWMINNP